MRHGKALSTIYVVSTISSSAWGQPSPPFPPARGPVVSGQALPMCGPELVLGQPPCRPSCDDVNVNRRACARGVVRYQTQERPRFPVCPPPKGEQRCTNAIGDLGWVDEYQTPVEEPPVDVRWAHRARLGVGPMFHLDHEGKKGGLGASFEAAGGALAVWTRGYGYSGPGVAFDLGAGWDTGARGGYRLFAGLGPVYKYEENFLVQYVPRFVLGGVDDKSVMGLRHGLRIAGQKSAVEIGGVEAAHQMLFIDGKPAHDVTLMLSLNPVVIVGLLFHPGG